MKILPDFDDVTRVIQEVTNRAIEKNQHKGTIQKIDVRIILARQDIF